MKNILIILLIVISCSSSLAQTSTDSQTWNDQIRKEKIKVFPNPADNVVNILGVKNSHKANIIISDVYGNIVLSHVWSIRNNALNIPVSTLKSGIYVINVHSTEQQIQTKFYKN